MDPAHTNPVLLELATRRAKELQSLSLSAIAELPPMQDEHVEGPKKIIVCVWHDVFPDGAHRVVVQANLPRLWGIFTETGVVGFVLSATGECRPLTEEEEWQYI